MKPLNIIVYDYETGSRNPWKTQPIQLAAVAIDGRTFKPLKNCEFNSMIRAVPDEDCDAYGLEKIEDDALKVNKKTRKEIQAAPAAKLVWDSFTDYVGQFHSGKSQWDAPIVAGFNNIGFDDIISYRMCRGNMLGEKEPYGFGPYDEKTSRAKLFHPMYNHDVAQIAYGWFRSRGVPFRNVGLDALREYLGLSPEGAHDALVDCYDTAEILVRFLKLQSAIQVNFEGACAKGRVVER